MNRHTKKRSAKNTKTQMAPDDSSVGMVKNRDNGRNTNGPSLLPTWGVCQLSRPLAQHPLVAVTVTAHLPRTIGRQLAWFHFGVTSPIFYTGLPSKANLILILFIRIGILHYNETD
ncbi:hypothetical protein J6590_077411 [Homalodisca vitripennis]|nr:hypothetical protein J6590_077411 [Homalodisca vitripennis]